MKKLLVLLIILPLLAGCTATGKSESPKAPTPADYHEGDAHYTLTVSDRQRSVTLDVRRENGVSTAVVTSPAELSDTVIIEDGDGVRLSLKTGLELPLTADASAGLSVFFRAMEKRLTPSEFSEGVFSFLVDSSQVSVTLSEEGFPTEIKVKNGSLLRSAEVDFHPEG